MGPVIARPLHLAGAMRVPGLFDGEHALAVTALAMVDSHDQALADLAPFEEWPVLEQALVHQYAKPTPLSDHRAEQLRVNPEGHRWAVDNDWIEGSPEQVVPAIRDAFTTLPNPHAFSIWFSMAPLRNLPDMALSLQTEIYLATYVPWQDADDDNRNRGWLSTVMQTMQPVTAGQYLGDSDLATRDVKFMADENWARLKKVLAKWNPERLFVGYLASPNGPTNGNQWQRSRCSRSSVNRPCTTPACSRRGACVGGVYCRCVNDVA
jgi:hypothetical protein